MDAHIVSTVSTVETTPRADHGRRLLCPPKGIGSFGRYMSLCPPQGPTIGHQTRSHFPARSALLAVALGLYLIPASDNSSSRVSTGPSVSASTTPTTSAASTVPPPPPPSGPRFTAGRAALGRGPPRIFWFVVSHPSQRKQELASRETWASTLAAPEGAVVWYNTDSAMGNETVVVRSSLRRHPATRYPSQP